MLQQSLINFYIAGLLGFLLHLFAVKIPSLQEKARVGNLTFSVGEYFKQDWMALIANLLAIGICVYAWDEIVGFNPAVNKYAKFFFVSVGFSNSSILLAILSVTNKRIMSAIDIKTNISDGIQPPVDNTNKEGVKEIAKSDAPVVDINTNQPPSA